jgi:uncharacterized protein
MRDNRLFLDTAFAQALLNPRDQHHITAQKLLGRVDKATEIWTTNLILIEIGDALSAVSRQPAIAYIKRILANNDKYRVVGLDDLLFDNGFLLYSSRPDKDWGLTDCVSFTVMRQNNIDVALTTDQHFVQAGFRALMLETPYC